MKQTSPCPKCGELAGYWESVIHAYMQYHPHGYEPFAEDFDPDIRSKTSRVKHCANCDKIITKLIVEEKA